jgi:hypothetical protein
MLPDGVENESVYETKGLSTYESVEAKIIEGIFTGDGMLGSDGNIYPVPHNYSSKSLLVQGSKLKASIYNNGKILYKIIEEIPYETDIGIVAQNADKYQIITEKKTYSVLLAAVTFHKAEIGDKVSIRLPKDKIGTYAVIESVIH